LVEGTFLLYRRRDPILQEISVLSSVRAIVAIPTFFLFEAARKASSLNFSFMAMLWVNLMFATTISAFLSLSYFT